MKSKKGVIHPIMLAFGIVFASVSLLAIANIPGRSALKTKLTDECMKENKDLTRKQCWESVSSMTQKEREKLGEK